MTELKQYRIAARSAAGLVGEVEGDVAAGRLARGQRLPSVRRMAADAGISPATVAAGLAELRRRGVVVTEPRRGTRVAEGPPVGLLAAPMPVPGGGQGPLARQPRPPAAPRPGRCHRPRRAAGPPLWRGARAGRAAAHGEEPSCSPTACRPVSCVWSAGPWTGSSGSSRRACARATGLPWRIPATRTSSTCCGPRA